MTMMPRPMLLPPPPGHCRICARKHPPADPHDAQSLFYGMRFKMRYGREGTWADAIAHCSEEMQKYWIAALTKAGAYTEPPPGVTPIAEAIDG